MSYGTYFTAEIYLSRESYDNIHELNEEIRYTEREIQSLRERILMYGISGPSGVNNKDCEGNDLNPVDVVHCEMTNLLDLYDDEQAKLQNLYYLKEDWDEKEGKFKTAEVG